MIFITKIDFKNMEQINNYDEKLSTVIERDTDIGFDIGVVYRRKLAAKKYVFGWSKPTEFEACLLGFSLDDTFVQENWHSRRDLTHFKRRIRNQWQARCLCTQGFAECCYIQNNDTGDIVRIGKDCLQKIEKLYGYEPVLSDELSNSIKALRKFEKDRECILLKWCKKHCEKQEQKFHDMMMAIFSLKCHMKVSVMNELIEFVRLRDWVPIDDVCDFGKHKNKTYREIIAVDENWIIWFIGDKFTNSKYNNIRSYIKTNFIVV